MDSVLRKPFRLLFLNRLFKLFFLLLYHQFAWTYDWIAAGVSLGNWNEWVLHVIPYLHKSPVLELGHGPGHLQLALKQTQTGVFGLDASKQMSRLASRRLQKAGYSPWLVNGVTQALPFRENTFPYIVATFPTEYIADPQTLDEVWRVLQPGGQVIIMPLAWITGKSHLERLAASLFRVTSQSIDLPSQRELAQALDVPQEQNLGKHNPWIANLLEHAGQVGFNPSLQFIPSGNSVLMIIYAQKTIST